MAEVCNAKHGHFVDILHLLFLCTKRLTKPLTLNDPHLLDHGADAVAKVIIDKLFGINASQAVKRAHVERNRKSGTGTQLLLV